MNVDPTKGAGQTRNPEHLRPAADPEEAPDAFERALQQRLRSREAVPADLTARLLAIAPETTPAEAPSSQQRKQRSSIWKLFLLPELPLWAAGAVAALLVLIVTLAGGTAIHARQRQHARAAEATRNFELATSIEDKALEHTRQQLREAGIPF